MGSEILSSKEMGNPGIPRMVGDFFMSAFHSGIESPINGATQLINEIGDFNIKPLQILTPAQPTSTADSYVEKIGSAVGMVAPFFVLSNALGKAADCLKMTSLAERLSLSPLLESSIFRAGVSGAVYGGVFNPVAAGESGWSRLRNATVDGAAFATLAASAQGLTAASDELRIFKSAPSALATTVKDIGINMAAGIPAGFVSTEGQSLLGKGQLASGSDLKQSAVRFMTIGGTLASVTHAHLD